MDKIAELIKKEEKRQKTTLQMIPSENFASKEVRKAIGSVLMNKYSEGYPHKRYYQGNEYIDQIEKLAIEEAKKLFEVPYANVQPYSGSPANAEVYFALLEAGDTIMGMDLSSGGHLTHGHPKITFSGKYFKSVQYSVKTDGSLDYDKIRKIALENKPKIIISGLTSYPGILDFKKFGKIAGEVGAYHLADISHIAGLVVGGVYPSPFEHAHIIMTTTHKTLRGPRGAVILVTNKGLEKDPELPSKIDKAVFPGMQGGPHNNTTAGILVCFQEAQTKEFKKYAQQIVSNAETLSQELIKLGYKLVTNGTKNHLILIDLSNKNIDGWFAAWALEYAGIIVNRNTIPYDEKNPFYPSGIRLGTPAITTMGMKQKEMTIIATLIDRAIKTAVKNLPQEINKETRKNFKNILAKNKEISKIKKEVESLCKNFN